MKRSSRRFSPPTASYGVLLYRVVRWVVIAFSCAVLGLQVWYFAWIMTYRWQPPTSTSVMRLRQASAVSQGKPYTLRYQWTDFDRIAPALKKAVIAAEDAKFVQHHGFDWYGMQVAAEKNYHQHKIVAGGSTISQQLAKNLFLSGERTYLRKLQEAVITLMLETVLSKRRILELYLNVIEWGDGVFGASAAAKFYYRTSAYQLSAFQAARLAALVPNPLALSRSGSTGHFISYNALQERIEVIQERMHAVTVSSMGK